MDKLPPGKYETTVHECVITEEGQLKVTFLVEGRLFSFTCNEAIKENNGETTEDLQH